MEKWNYEAPENISGVISQSDWNSTLITAFNCVAKNNNMYHKSCCETFVPIKFKNLIESLFFYDDAEQMVSEKYKIIFIEDELSVITIEGCELEILNFKDN